MFQLFSLCQCFVNDKIVKHVLWRMHIYIWNIAQHHCLKEQYCHSQSRLSTGHGIGVVVSDEHSDWKLLAHLCSSNGNMTLSRGGIMEVTELI